MYVHREITWATTRGYIKLQIKTDSTLLAHSLHSMRTLDISIQWMLSDIQKMAGTLQWCQVLKLSREQIKNAHDLAN